jgi:hypothetical protein
MKTKKSVLIINTLLYLVLNEGCVNNEITIIIVNINSGMFLKLNGNNNDIPNRNIPRTNNLLINFKIKSLVMSYI